MNRNRYRLVFNATLGMMVPVAEIARGHGKSGHGKAASGPALALAGVLLAGSAQAEVPVASANFVGAGTTASYQVNGAQAYVNQVGNKAIVNFDKFNISAGNDLRFQQVNNLAALNLVPGANFSVLARIHDINPSIIAGSISQAAGQQANVIMVNSNGIAFLGGSQVNLNSFTATSLNIADTFVLDSFFPASFQTPQFEGTGGFIKVFEGAKITAGSFGRVLLIAPTVVNKGTVTAPNGQVIAAAGTKVYLRSAAGQDNNVRGLLVEVDSPDGLSNYDTENTSVQDGMLDGNVVALKNAAEDKLGHVTNLGELSTPRGNVTMIGYAVNQLGMARATTSVVANGSVYLLAKDEAVNNVQSTRGGRVILGAGSVTEVLPDVSDATGVQDGGSGARLEKVSQVQVLGQEIRMEGGALIDAPAGDVVLIAQDNPGAGPNDDPFANAGSASFPRISDVARIHIADGARINVAGLEKVQISAARNSVEVELRGDELKDSPVNQEGPLRGQKAYVDINRALANANAGKSTLIAKDSLESYQARLERTVAERSTTGGTVGIRSQGEVILEGGAVIDLSGGSVQYTAATLKTTLLTTGGNLVDLADANAETRYDGIATRYIREYKRWNRTEVIDLGQSFRYDPGYVEGKDAGALSVIGMKAAVVQADVQGRTTTGELQREVGIQPLGAKLTLGSGRLADADYKLNQRIEISSTAATLPASFGFGETLPTGLANTLALNPALFGKDKVARLEVFSNQAAEVREALRLPQGGSVAITAQGVAINADVEAAAGTISFNARANSANTNTVPLDVTVAKGVTLSARGIWANDLPTAAGHSGEAALVNGGSVTLSAVGDVTLGTDTLIDVTGGGRLKPDGKLKGGNGGDVTLGAGAGVSAAAGTHTAEVRLGGEVRGHALAKGGTFTINTGKIQIGGVTDPAALNLDPDFVTRGGFFDFKLTGRDGITVADGVTLAPRVESLELQQGYTLQSTGSRIENFSRTLVREDRIRQATNLTLTADGYGLGVVRVGDGAHILADDRATISFNAGKRTDIRGEVKTAGGTINATLNSDTTAIYDPTNTVWLGPQAVLDVSGAARTYLDTQGKQVGEVLAGGTVSLNAASGFVVTEVGSIIKTNGVAPVRLDVPNEAGGLGRMVGSDAGTISIAAREGVLLDGALQAQAGGAAQRGGTFTLALGSDTTVLGTGYPTEARVVSLAPTTVAQAGGLTPGAEIPPGFNGQARLGADALETAGFERIALKSRSTIRLENDLALGGNSARPLREIKLDAPRIETAGGNAALTANTIRLGNYDAANQGAPSPEAGTGVFRANAQLLELAGIQTITGMARAELTGAQEVRLVGVSTNDVVRPTGMLRTAADLVIHGALIAPITYSQYTIDASGRAVEFTRNTSTPVQPLSALGSLTVIAQDIVQGGNLWVPFGQINLEAKSSLIFKDGSLTSVAAAPGSLTPFGRVENGRTWTYQVGGASIEIEALPEKSIRTKAPRIDMQAGAKLDLAGGGDLSAYEFTVGPGGSRDLLADKSTYAILPGYTSGFAPSDVQESFDRASGDAVYLSGVPGLVDGVYTLLPAHYALLPGAYAVKFDTGVKDLLPGQAYSRQDGVRIAAGYVTDSRVNVPRAPGQPDSAVPRDARWSGIEVLTRAQVLARSELALTRASEFFADSRNRPQDAGLLSVATTGIGADSLKLDAIYNFAAGSGGRGGAVDISALNLAIVDGTSSGIDPIATQLDVDRLNALGAASLFIGGTRTTSGDTTTLTVNANTVTLANDADNALQVAEVILAAKDTLTLKSGSLINAQGDAGDAGRYETAGEGALVRAASTTASFVRTSPGTTLGTLTGDGKIVAADSITLDATRVNAFRGTTEFRKSGVVVAGNLGVGATRVNFGPVANAEGITYSQADLEAFSALKSLTLSSYSTFDLHGGVNVGGVDVNGKPTLQNLTLQGAGLAGINNNGASATLRAQNLTLSNPASPAAAFTPGGTLGDGALAILADTLTLGEGRKSVQGFSAVTITANELVGKDTGTTNIAAPLTLNVARIGGTRGANQSLTVNGKLIAAKYAADRTLAAVNALGAQWALAGTSVDFNTQAVLPSGEFKLTATGTAPGSNVTLGADASVDVAGRTVQFFDVSKPSWGGTSEFVSATGDVTFIDGSEVDVSAAAGGDAGALIVRSTRGKFTLADGSVRGAATVDAEGKRSDGEGARVDIDTGSLGSFSALNTALNKGGIAVEDDFVGGFDGERKLRVRSGDVSIAADDTLKALNIKIAADGGKLDVAGKLDASGKDAGRIELFAKDDVNVLAGAQFDAFSTGAGKDGGDIEIGTRDGSLNFGSSIINVTGGSGGAGGTVLLRAPRTGDVGAETDVAINRLDAANALGSVEITGARSVAVEAVRVYDKIGTSDIDTLVATGANSGTTLSLATITANNTAFGGHYATIKDRLGKVGDPIFHILSGVEVRASGNLTLGSDWNLANSRAGGGAGEVGEAGVLTLRAQGNLSINNNLSDGFNVATTQSGGNPATLLGGESWSYRLVAGADSAAADPLAVKRGSDGVVTDLTLAAGKLIRTGSGDIRIVSGNDIKLADNRAAIYTAGRLADPVSGFIAPTGGINYAQFSQGGGDVELAALADITGFRSQQLYSNWLFRQGRLADDRLSYTVRPAWWVRFDQFQQGVGALGGGDVTLLAGGRVQDVSASTPTQARQGALTPDPGGLVKTGGGTVRVEAGDDLLGGQYYADNGELILKTGGSVGSGQLVGAKPFFTILALGDAQARVQANKSVDIQAVINPHLVVQASRNSGGPNNNNVTSNGSVTSSTSLWSLFFTYSEVSAVSLHSLSNDVVLHNNDASAAETSASIRQAYGAATPQLNFGISNLNYASSVLLVQPPSLSVIAFQGSIRVDAGSNGPILSPASLADLSLLAAGSVSLNTRLTMSDTAPLPDAVRPDTQSSEFREAGSINPRLRHAATPVHRTDNTPVRIYAVTGDVAGNSSLLILPKAVRVRAGHDVKDLVLETQHVQRDDISQIEAGRDVLYTPTPDARSPGAYVWVGGPGRLEVTAGRDINLGASAGIVSRGNLDNVALPPDGADIHVTAGVGSAGVDYSGAVDRLVAKLETSSLDDTTLWLARWLTGNDSLTGPEALAAVKAVDNSDAETQRTQVRSLVFTALRTTGRDSNNQDSRYAADYVRGYAALELLFPGIEEKNTDGSFKNYQGDIDLFASRILTERGGNVEFMTPGGNVIVSLSNTAEDLLKTQVPSASAIGLKDAGVLGIATLGEGDIKGFARDDILVNQSRILTVGGGDVLLWSSEGDIDAGKGKKTATSVPPPLILVDSQGNVSQVLQGAATGSGIGALSTGGVAAGDVDLIAPKGTVNAGDAGIRAGNLNIAAQVVLGADNISVSGSSTGTPVADTSAVTAASSGASTADGGVSNATKALSQGLSEAARAAEELKQSFKPTFISAEVIGHGDCAPGEKPPCNAK